MIKRITVLPVMLMAFTAQLNAQVELEVVQTFKEGSIGSWNQVSFVDVDGDGDDDMVARYAAPTGTLTGIWLFDATTNKFSDSVDCKIDLDFVNNSCFVDAGDINGDGMADIAMLSGHNTYHAPKIVFGRAVWPDSIKVADVECDFPDDPNFTQGSQYSSPTVGDFNDDGYADVVFPDQGTTHTTTATGDPLDAYNGRAVMYFGSANFDATPDLVLALPGETMQMALNDSDAIMLRWFGPFMDTGDFNGDGYTDLFAGAFYSSTSIEITSAVTGQVQDAFNTGAGVIYLGGYDFDDVPDAIMVPPDDFLQFTSPVDYMNVGYWMFNAGDIDGDGADDVSLPSWYWAINFAYSGNRGLFQMPSLFQTKVYREPMFYYTKDRYSSAGWSDQWGANLVPMGDVNGDGYPDLGNAKNYLGAGPLDPGIRLFFTTPTHSDAINWDFETDEYSHVLPFGRDLDGDGIAEMLLTLNDGTSRVAIVRIAQGPTGVDEQETASPGTFQLHGNYPNPFNPTTTLWYETSVAGVVSIVLYDIRGKEVFRIAKEFQSIGMHEIVVDGAALESGIYVYEINGASGSVSGKMALIK